TNAHRLTHFTTLALHDALPISVHYYPNETHETVAKEVEEHILNVAAADPWLKENPPLFTWGGTSMIEDRGEIFPSLEVDENHEADRKSTRLNSSHVSISYAVFY